jgi:hypothetical protein
VAVEGGERRDRVPVARPRGLHHPVEDHGGEEELAHDRFLDEEEHVRRAAPQLPTWRLAQLAA